MADAQAPLKRIRIRPLVEADALQLARLLRVQSDSYMQHFGPFPFDAEVIAKALRVARDDRYWRLDLDGTMVGFSMLRGPDAGYSRPSFGIFVAEHAKGQGVARAALKHAIGWARERRYTTMMLKVAAENVRAAAIYRDLGFTVHSICPDTGQTVMQHDLLRVAPRTG